MISIDQTSYRTKDYTETIETLDKYRALAGITRLADITHLDYSGIPVYTAIRPRAKSLSTSQGKGLTQNAAKCSALMEAIEVYFAENVSPEITNKSVYDLNKNNICYIPPNKLNNSIYYTNDKENMNWVKTEAVIYGNTVFAPFSEYSLNSYLDEVLIYSPNTTGLSGGNTYKEALLHSLLEIIERESTDLEIEVGNIKNDLLNQIKNFFEYKIFYKKNTYGIPSFEMLLQSKKPFDNQIWFKGSGCHLNKDIALNRAITEAVQSRVTTIAGSRDDIIDSKYEASNVDWISNGEFYNFDDITDYPLNDIEKGIDFLFERITKLGQEVLVFKYYDEDICILKAKIVSLDCINNV